MGFFDRFAERATTFVSRAPFFSFCLLLVLAWLIEGAVRVALSGLHGFTSQTYQLQINTTTTIITFLLVALLENANHRFEKTTNQKLNAIADFLADVARLDENPELDKHIDDLREAVGLEEKTGT